MSFRSRAELKSSDTHFGFKTGFRKTDGVRESGMKFAKLEI